ncbi:MAG: OmpA family protein [Crocinitomicaceae bacterium]|jgi:OOP family OmpA-OmpF porin|nr:OmpA family protein [Crocinitomicaceae bacterium]
MQKLAIIALICFSQNLIGQINFLDGTWQGIITTGAETYKQGTAIWFDFKIDKITGDMKGESRLETPFTNYFAYKNIKGKAEDRNLIHFEDVIIGLQENDPGKYWCTNRGTLSYNDSTGYLTGSWTSEDCKRANGKIILYRSKYHLSKKDTASLYHSWFNNFAGDLERGWNAYYVRDSEMRNFQFVPVYFDHDKDSLKAEYLDYLKNMARIVNSHTDLRIKIIGHTDSNGTDEYNVDLSARRAEAIRLYLISQGVKADKIVIEFRGEKDPATTNDTPEGKRMNRRVDFEFI